MRKDRQTKSDIKIRSRLRVRPVTTLKKGQWVFQLGYENDRSACLDDIIVVTESSKENHMDDIVAVLTKLENAGYGLSENKSERFETEIELICHKIDQNCIRPLQNKLLASKKF